MPYLEGALPSRAAQRVERHFVDCESCRELLVRLRAGHQMAHRLQQAAFDRAVHPEFAVLMAGLGRAPVHRLRRSDWADWFDRLATPRAVTALAALVIVQLALLVVSNRGVLFGERSRVSMSAASLDLGEFRQLTIPELRSNTQPHVATDGYVYDVHTDPEEGTVAFKLAEKQNAAGQFVVCEIITQMPPPRDGDHVRVYGVARYDAQTDRKWYEVNPVLSVAALNR